MSGIDEGVNSHFGLLVNKILDGWNNTETTSLRESLNGIFNVSLLQQQTTRRLDRRRWCTLFDDVNY